MFIDADIYIPPDMAALPDIPGPGFYVMTDISQERCGKHFPWWARKLMGDDDHRIRSWSYRNTGVWICDKDTAEKLLAVAKPPYRRGVQEQHQLNYWLFLLSKDEVHVGELPPEWNCMPGQESKELPPSFHHLCGVHKGRCYHSLVTKGFVPMQEPTPSSPPPEMAPLSIPGGFDPTPYHVPKRDMKWAMDLLHVQLLHGAAHLKTTRPNNERVAVEVGSWQGFSTSALIEAVNLGLYSHLHVVETNPVPELYAVIAKCKYPERVTLHHHPMWELDLGRIDFAFIDGCHKAGAFADLFIATACGAEIICMHDGLMHLDHTCWGAVYGAKFLRRMPGWHYVEDGKRRSGADTTRGFLVAAKQEIDLTIVQELIDRAP